MSEKDMIFKYITDISGIDPNSYGCFGGEGKGYYAFWYFAEVYYEAAETLYLNFQYSRGVNATLDGVVYPMCFMYRHFVELSMKYLYVKFKKPTDKELALYLQNGKHYIDGAWYAIKPTLKALRDRYPSKVSLGAIEHYVMEWHNFDKDSMRMRYPVDNNLKLHNEKNTRLDIPNLHDRMKDLYDAIMQLSFDLDGTITEEIQQNLIKDFKAKYDSNIKKVEEFISLLATEAANETQGFRIKSFQEPFENWILKTKVPEFLETCTNVEKILLEELFYAARSVGEHLIVMPRSPYEKVDEFVKACIIHMHMDGFKFDSDENIEYLNIQSKMASTALSCLKTAYEIMEWRNKMPKGRP